MIDLKNNPDGFAKAFAKLWLESIANGRGLEHMIDNVTMNKAECSAYAAQLRAKLKKLTPPVILPNQKKPGRTASVSAEDLSDIASLFE